MQMQQRQTKSVEPRHQRSVEDTYNWKKKKETHGEARLPHLLAVSSRQEPDAKKVISATEGSSKKENQIIDRITQCMIEKTASKSIHAADNCPPKRR